MFFLRLISRLPLRILYWISNLLFFGGYYVVKYRRDVVWKNLSNSFPEKNEKERRAIEKQFYRNLCDYPMETLRMLTMTEEELRSRLKFTNPDLLEKFSQAGTSIFLITSHQFNWEWLIAAVSLMKTHPVYYVYQPQSNVFFDQFSNAIRQRFGAKGIKRDQVARETIKLRKSLHALATVADQFPGFVQDKKYWAVFLNQRTAFFQGVQQIAALSNDPAIYFSMRRVSRGRFECDLVLLAEPPYDKDSFNVVEGFVRATEKTIQNQPDGWLWSHNRWKIVQDEFSA